MKGVPTFVRTTKTFQRMQASPLREARATDVLDKLASTPAQRIDYSGPKPRAALRARLETLVPVLTGEPLPPGKLRSVELIDHLVVALADAQGDRIWLTFAVLGARLPASEQVRQAVRRCRTDGPLVVVDLALDFALDRHPEDEFLAAIGLPKETARFFTKRPVTAWPSVEIVTGETIIDLHRTAESELATGIQRVAREVSRRWVRDHNPLLVRWSQDCMSLQRCTPSERRTALFGERPDPVDRTRVATVLVPWRCRYITPELAAEPARVRALIGMLDYGGTPGASIGHDCVPLASAETVARELKGYPSLGMFAFAMSAIRRFDRIAAVSEGSAVEHRGWGRILASSAMPVPEIRPIPEAIEKYSPTPEAMALAVERICVPGMPMVLAVGSFEPRKNHLALLHAADLLWREGLSFSLTLIGGQAWHSEPIVAKVDLLRSQGRAVESLTAVSDELLWAAYRQAAVLMFPSLDEGFGLPVAEALASGTPVITSEFGPMAEIAQHGGALLVNPYDDHSIADGLRSVLTEPGLRDRLAEEAAKVPTRSWDEYAAETWQFLTGG